MANNDGRLPYPQFNAFRPFVMKELSRRKIQGVSMPAAPFLRLTSCVTEPNLGYAFFTLGLHGLDTQDVNIFDLAHGNDRDVVGYACDLRSPRRNGKMLRKLIVTDDITMDDFTKITKNVLQRGQTEEALRNRANSAKVLETIYARGTHPVPGIENASVKIRGLGMPLIAEISWTCYNQAQLEYLRHHFLSAGNYCVFEWGQQFSDKSITKMLDFSDDAAARKAIARSVLEGRKYVIEEWCEPNDGNYNFLVGQVGNFKVDLDSRTGVYTCSTTLVGVGEQIYGVSNDVTFVRTSSDPETALPTSINTVSDYFQPGQQFDLLVGEHSNNAKLVAENFANWGSDAANINRQTSDLREVSQNPHDYRFVSWEFFATKLIPNILTLISHTNADNQLASLCNFWQDAPTDEDSARFSNWVGNNQFLKSTEPDTMVIVNQSMQTYPKYFAGAGVFGDKPGRGLLNNGVWLNTGMIRSAFLEATSLERAISGMLMRMNNATAGFWGLRMVWDDENAYYKIVDTKYMDSALNPRSMWKFNEGTMGEALEISFDAAFPPELVTQMMMYARFRGESQSERDRLMKEYPMIGTTSAFMFSVNYTAFEDFVSQDIKDAKQKTDTKPLEGSVVAPRAEGNDRTAAKVTTVSNVAGASLATDGMRGAAGKTLGQPIVALAANTNSFLGDDVNRSVFSGTKPPAPSPDVTKPYNRKDKLEPGFRFKLELLEAKFREKNISYMIEETWRSPARQQYIYQKGRSRPGGVATQVTDRSYHLVGQAADIRILNSKGQIDWDATTNFYPQMVAMTNEVGLRTIGEWDAGHVQVKLEDRVALSNFDAAWNAGGGVAATFDPANPKLADGFEREDTSPVISSIRDISERFGSEMISVIASSKSSLLNLITTDGYAKYPNQPNAFLFGFPTTATIEVTTRGLSGVSISDGFYVDKIPFIFEKHGCFQTTEITDKISTNGWTTTFRGVFKMLWILGERDKNDKATPISSVPEQQA